MRRVLVSSLPKKIGALVAIEIAEAKHLTSVLRLGPGDEIILLDGSGFQTKAKLVFREKNVFAEAIDVPTTDSKLTSLPIHLFQSIVKGDAMEWIVEKATELGVRTFSPIETEFTVVDLKKRGADSFQNRWQRISDQALKQCGRLDRMVVKTPMTLEEALLTKTHVLWLDETFHDLKDIHFASELSQFTSVSEKSLLVGPEGGFSPSERSRLLQLTGSNNHEITRVNLGSIILRAETASILGISMLVGNHYGKR